MNDETHIGLAAGAGDGADAAAAPTNVDAPVPAGRSAAVTVPADVLARVHDLYVGGRNLDALEVALTAGPLDRWTGAEARIMAGRLAGNLGAARLARVHHLRAYRAEPGHPLARYYYARAMIERRGPYETWQFMTRCGAPNGADPDLLADWLAFEALIAAMLRDFGAAERGIGRALEIAPERAWIHVERASILNQQDKPADALASAMRALALSPLYRPGLQFAAEMLIMMDRDAEAIALLEDAAARTQSAAIVGHLAALVGEAGDKPRARALWERVVELSPMADKDYLKFLSARRCDAAYACGDYSAAAELARQAGKGFHAKIAERLSGDLRGKERVELKVPFVRQDHMTCAPATLTALARFWGKSAEHLGVVEEICYDGTPAHSERAWAERNGFVVREFRATWESAVGLIDRGVPFTLTTTETTGAHLQAVTGYDARRHTLLLRDPSTKHEGEVRADGLVEVYKSTGPRAMALVPADRAELFDGLELPEAGLYDLFYRVQTALVAHRREAAAAAYGEMVELDRRERANVGAKPHEAERKDAPADAPGRLVCWARRSIGAYDSDHSEQLSATEALIAQFPDDAVLQLGKLGLLRDLSRRSEILETLSAAAAAPKADLIFSFQYANELANDPRELPRATRMLRRYVRYRGGDAIGYGALASLLWQAREREEALALYRVATCLNDKDDRLAVMYFGAARYFGKAADAIALVADRFARFGGRSAVPAITLFRVMAAVDRTPEAFAALDKGLKKRPHDADLMLFMADQCARYGRTARSVELLARAEGKAHPTALRRVRATVATYRGELAAALADWEAVLKADPLAQDANENVVQLIAETRGREAAVAHLRAVCARFEHN
ncbi:MAG: C39 family peptidase [Phycisphaerae bacterium]